MGNVKSFCCKDGISDIDDCEERSRILNDNCGTSCDDLYNNSTTSALSHQDSVSYGSINNGDGSKTMEQSALDKIYQKMASNVIDVAPGESMVIQQAEFIERQKAYQAKLNQIKAPIPLKLTNCVAKHVSGSYDESQEKRRVEYEPISVDDIQLINEISLKSAEAVKNLKINSQEQVVTRFKP